MQLSEIPTYPRQITHALRHRILSDYRKFRSRCRSTEQSSITEIEDFLSHFPISFSLLTVPSAVHLTTCFMSDSQHLRLSVLASLPLSPLQRFIYYIKIDAIPITCMCQEFLCKTVSPFTQLPIITFLLTSLRAASLSLSELSAFALISSITLLLQIKLLGSSHIPFP